jgi:hypothetical protein
MCCRISIEEKSETAEVPTPDATYDIDAVAQPVASATREPHRVTGDPDIGKTNQDFVLDLNSHTIFNALEIAYVMTYDRGKATKYPLGLGNLGG